MQSAVSEVEHCDLIFVVSIQCFVLHVSFLQTIWTTSPPIPKNTRTHKVRQLLQPRWHTHTLWMLAGLLHLLTRWHSVACKSIHYVPISFSFSFFFRPPPFFFAFCLCCSCLGDRVRGSRQGQRQPEAGGEFTLDALHVYHRPLQDWETGWQRKQQLLRKKKRKNLHPLVRSNKSVSHILAFCTDPKCQLF